MDSQSPVVSSINLAIRSDDLRIRHITEELGFEPTKAFEKGQEYQSVEKIGDDICPVTRCHPWGVWHFDTATFVTGGKLIEDHALFLLNRLESVSDRILALLTDSNYKVLLTIWYVGPGGFDLSSSTATRLASLCNEIRITCWDSDEIV
jgi:hypothetical protein